MKELDYVAIHYHPVFGVSHSYYFDEESAIRDTAEYLNRWGEIDNKNGESRTLVFK